MSDALRVLRLPCSGHAALLSREFDAPLSPGERCGLRIHTAYCRGCRRFRAHLRQMRALARTLADSLGDEPSLPADVRARLDARVRDTLKKK